MASDRRAAPHRRSSGFVLAVTLWVLAGITIAVALMTQWALTRVHDAERERGQLVDEASMYETRDTILYLLATRERTYAGQPTRALTAVDLAKRKLTDFGTASPEIIGGELRMDDTPYHGFGSSLFELQDEAGLFSMIWPRESDLDRFLAVHDVPPDKWPRLFDTFRDYVDSDDLKRLHGAEARDYEERHRQPPPNRRLLVPSELTRVLGWDGLPPATLASMINQVTVTYAGAMNPNTMPESLLPLRIPGCPETCRRLVRARRERPFTSTFDLEARLGIKVLGDELLDYRYVPSNDVRITLWRRTGVAWRIHVELTPLADHAAPWSVLAAYPVVRPQLHEPAEQTGSPLFAHEATDRE